MKIRVFCLYSNQNTSVLNRKLLIVEPYVDADGKYIKKKRQSFRAKATYNNNEIYFIYCVHSAQFAITVDTWAINGKYVLLNWVQWDKFSIIKRWRKWKQNLTNGSSSPTCLFKIKWIRLSVSMVVFSVDLSYFKSSA